MSKTRIQYRRFGPLLLFVLTLIGTTAPSWALDPSSPVAPRVVLVTGYMEPEGQEPYVTASGYLIDEGFVVSVNNVFTRPLDRRLCERFLIRFRDGREAQGAVHSVDPILNLIVFKLMEPGPTVPVGAVSHDVRPGDEVWAVAGGGSPDSVPYTMGYVKARHKQSVYGAGLGDMFIDSQLRLPPKGDGGPLLDAKGRVVGINTPNIHRPDHIEDDPGEAHALPIRVVTGFLKMAKAFPTAQQSWLGLAFRPLSPGEKKAAYQILGQSAGVFVDYVWTDGPAGQTGIAAGDILVSVNGKKTEHLHELDRLLLELPPGEPAELALLRGNRGLFERVAVERRPPWAGHVVWRLPQEPASAGQGPRADLESK